MSRTYHRSGRSLKYWKVYSHRIARCYNRKVIDRVLKNGDYDADFFLHQYGDTVKTDLWNVT